MIDKNQLSQYIDSCWENAIIPALVDYIKIPNKSPHFDVNWQQAGHMQKAVDLIFSWCQNHAPKGTQLEVVQLPERTPLIFAEIPGDSGHTILMYGHLDKQPEMVGWREGLGPWKPVLEGDKLFGRGGADDGYAAFASLTAINALQHQNIPHSRIVMIIEACEESGSFDLPYYIDALQDRIGHPDLVICLDSGAGNYDQLWMTTSLRGNVVGNLTVSTLTEGIHSGYGSGIVADSFRISRALLERIEDQETGEIRLPELHCPIPDVRQQQAEACADILGAELENAYPRQGDTQPMSSDRATLILNRTWRPALTVTGSDGMPAIADAGNVLRPYTSLKLSMRTPPEVDAKRAGDAMRKVIMASPPYHASVDFHIEDAANGWHAPIMPPWLSQAVNQASQQFYGKDAAFMGEGGTIPFMFMLGQKFPEAQFMITGVLGPHSNAHGPNEFLHIPMVKKLTACVAWVISSHYQYAANIEGI
ncbi:M20 family metallopeptidase [Legionella sp. W05-934-2]|jgi:acetylornithine deacetylase/succinyl-diaminopimelate desuccinylase-like protein|uniref:M20 family metallopeptidase n=1 Tax=Legionella sp. W05-934-2 TaxID=1198649 RepID=UPI0034625877